MSLNVHKILKLYKTPSKFYIQPIHQPGEALVIDRQTCEITLNSMFYVSQLAANVSATLIYGIVGIKHLMNRSYLIVITNATPVGDICGQQICRVDRTQIIPFSDGSTKPKDGQHDWEATYVSMLESVLKMPSFYYSYSYDLTNTLQRNQYIQSLITKDKSGKVEAHRCHDKRFLWNHHVMNDLERCGDTTSRYRLPIILGFVRINKVQLGDSMNWTLVSRRGVHRAGTRYNSRGIDHDGKVANFVETEQIIEASAGIVGSFVQIRGSIPLYWKQTPGYKYKPEIELDVYQDHDTPMKKHFDELISFYGNVSVVNLIDHKGHEGNLEREFSQRIGQLQKYYHIPYHYFDFHKECAKMRWYRLSILMERIESEIRSYAYFAICKDEVLQLQEGVVRSNCIDSLDRTNVVQSMVAQQVLVAQLKRFRLIPEGLELEGYTDFLQIFKDTWADNADALSLQYAGTPALKTDFTRTGKRTQAGILNDGLNSLTRYVSNNFFDQFRQDAIDLFLGHFEGYPSPLYRPKDLTTYTSTLPVTVVVLTLVALFLYFRL